MDTNTTPPQNLPPRPKPTEFNEMTKEQKAERLMVLLSLSQHRPPPKEIVCAKILTEQWEDWEPEFAALMEEWGGNYIREVDARAKANGYRDLEPSPSPGK